MTIQQPSKNLGASLLALSLVAAGGASAQIKRTPVLAADVAAAPGHEAVIVRAELDPAGSVPRHTHPGDEISYVLEGEAEVLIDGEKARVVKAARHS